MAPWMFAFDHVRSPRCSTPHAPADSRTLEVLSTTPYIRQFVEATRTLVTDAFIIFQRGTPLGTADRQGHRLWENRFVESIRVQAMDASHVSLVIAEMTDVAFMDRPRVYTPETETSIGMNLNQVAKVLRCADDNDRVVLLSDSDPRIGRVYLYVYRPHINHPEQSFFRDLYDEGSFRDVFHNGDPNRRLRVQLKRRIRPESHEAARPDAAVVRDGQEGSQHDDQRQKYKEKDEYEQMLPRKEMVFDLPKVFVDEPAIGVPPTPPGYTIVMSSQTFANIASHLTSLADTLDISVFFEQSCADLAMEDDGAIIKVRHKVVFSSSYGPDLMGRHELRTKRETVGLDKAMDMAEDETAVITVLGEGDVDEADVMEEKTEEQRGEKMVSTLLTTLSFASRYLETFSKAVSICDIVQLHMNEDSPIGVSYLGKSGVQVRYFLAPKIQDE